MKGDRRNPWKALRSKKQSSAQVFQLYRHGEAGKKKVEITWEEIRDQFNQQNGRCYWLGVKIDPMDIFDPWNALAPSLDRLDNDKGYVVGNVVITTRYANLGRGRLSADKVAPFVKQLRRLISNEMWPKFQFETPLEIAPIAPTVESHGSAQDLLP